MMLPETALGQERVPKLQHVFSGGIMSAYCGRAKGQPTWRRVAGGALFILLGLEGYQLATESTLFTSALAHLLFADNLHPVVEGQFYRSGQLSADRMRSTIERLRLKTVIDLRLGPDEPDAEGRSEPDTVRRAGAQYVHFPTNGSRLPTRSQLEELVAMLSTIETPALVHCSSGTHRTGVVSAIWLLIEHDTGRNSISPQGPVRVSRQGRSADRPGETDFTNRSTAIRAAGQLSLKYGFVAFERSLKSWIKGKQTIDHVIWSFLEFNARTRLGFRSYVAQLPDDTAIRSPDSAIHTTH